MISSSYYPGNQKKTYQNIRRFFRINLEIPHLVIMRESIDYKDIQMTGVNYYSPLVKQEIEQSVALVDEIYLKTKENKALISEMTFEIKETLSLFREIGEKIQKGELFSPQSIRYKKLLLLHKFGLTKIAALKESAPKTWYYLKELGQMIVDYAFMLYEVMTKSKKNAFYSPKKMPDRTACTHHLNFFKNNDLARKLPLVNLLEKIMKMVMAATDPIHRMVVDNGFQGNFNMWPIEKVSISEGGIAVNTKSKLELYSRLAIKMQLPNSKEIILVHGVVVSHHPEVEMFCYRIGIEFDFPSAQAQKMIRNEIQLQELNEYMEV